jgi:acetyl esterase
MSQPPMPLHPQVSKFLVQQAALGLKPIEQCTPAEFRQMMLDGLAAPGESEHVTVIEDHAADGSAGPIPFRIYRPTATGRLPALMYFHGGGWVGGRVFFFWWGGGGGRATWKPMMGCAAQLSIQRRAR